MKTLHHEISRFATIYTRILSLFARYRPWTCYLVSVDHSHFVISIHVFHSLICVSGRETFSMGSVIDRAGEMNLQSI